MNKKSIIIGMLLSLTALVFGISSRQINTVHASLSYLTIHKVDTNNPDLPLAGAVFEVRSQDGRHVETITTGEDGTALISLNPTIYYVTETKAPDGYELSDENKNIQVDARNADSLTLTLKNTKTSDLNHNNLDGDQSSTEGNHQSNADSMNQSTVPQTGITESVIFISISLFMLSLGVLLLRQTKKHI